MSGLRVSCDHPVVGLGSFAAVDVAASYKTSMDRI